MSASRSNRSARSPKKTRTATAAVQPPWIDDGIDYGPANTAARDLAMWALALAERDVEDWPTARKRVRNARRFVLARLAGKDRGMPVEDVIFTASLLARRNLTERGWSMSVRVIWPGSPPYAQNGEWPDSENDP